MARSTVRVVLAALVAFVAACDTPGAPNRGPDPNNLHGLPQHLGFRQWGTDAETQTQLVRAWGTWGVMYTASRDVTDEAVWTSSDPSVARITAPGRLQSVGAGETTLTATLGTLTATKRLRVFPGHPPAVISSGAGGTIYNSSGPSGENGLPGVKVEILTGHNAGRSTITIDRGQFTFDGPFYCGESTIRLTKAGFRDVTRAYTWCAEIQQSALAMTPG